MFESLTEKLENAINKIKGYGTITEDNISDAMREVRLALLEADVNYKVVKEFTNKVKEKALGEEVKKSLKPGDVFLKILKDELLELLGDGNSSLDLSSNPSIIMLVGLQGSGKTTTIGKLANLLRKKKGKKPLLIAADVYRPAAIDQLKQLGRELNIEVYEEGQNDAVKIAENGVNYAKEKGYDLVLIDTAGRLHVDEKLMDELKSINEKVNPSEIILVIDAMIGQDAINVINGFNDKLPLTGTILTKMDGDTRGGAALSIKAISGKPILYVGMGEKLSDLEQFYPDRMASRILGMGDVMSLIEKAQANIDEEKAKAMEQKMKKAQFDFNDYLDSMEQMRNMGGISSILNMLPGVGAKMKGQDLESMVDEKDMARKEAIVLSMTPKERENPDLINPSRKQRIAKGAGVDIAEVNRFIKQFEQSRKMMKQMTGMVGKGGKRGGFKLPF